MSEDVTVGGGVTPHWDHCDSSQHGTVAHRHQTSNSLGPTKAGQPATPRPLCRSGRRVELDMAAARVAGVTILQTGIGNSPVQRGASGPTCSRSGKLTDAAPGARAPVRQHRECIACTC